MTDKKIKLLFSLIALAIYNLLFWHEKLGINLPVFALFLFAFIVYQNNLSLKDIKVKISFLAVVFTGAFVVLFNTGISKFMHILSFFLLTGFAYENKFRALFHVLSGAVMNVAYSPVAFMDVTNKSVMHIKNPRSILFWIRLLFVPGLIFLVFLILYMVSNNLFGTMVFNSIEWFFNLLDAFFKIVSFNKILFLISGLFLIMSVVANKYYGYYLSNDLSYSDYICRQKMNRDLLKKYSTPYAGINGLNKELKSGVVLLAMLNIILMALNYVDIKVLWFGFLPPEQFNMKGFVHNGTYMLIFSILLSMIIVLYYFRKNQNFHSKNKILKLLAIVWIIQNVILCISLIIRNSYYIYYDGLAYKRIGLYAFILLTTIGLLTLILKIKKLKSFFYLLRINSWAAYFILITLSFFNWDMIIARTNINCWNGSGVDIDFYLKLSPQTYPYIAKNLYIIEKQMEQHKATRVYWVKNLDIDAFKHQLVQKKEQFIKDYSSHSLASWNYADYKAYNEIISFEKNYLTLKEKALNEF